MDRHALQVNPTFYITTCSCTFKISTIPRLESPYNFAFNKSYLYTLNAFLEGLQNRAPKLFKKLMFRASLYCSGQGLTMTPMYDYDTYSLLIRFTRFIQNYKFYDKNNRYYEPLKSWTLLHKFCSIHLN